jgi:protein O-mannosyl-transferase
MKSMFAKLDKLTAWQASLVITILGFATYFTGLANPFEGDDSAQIISNPVVHSLTHIKLFFEGGTFYNGGGIAPLSGDYYRPLMTTTFSLLYTIFGAHSFYFHLVQLLLCIGSAVLLYLFFRYSFAPLLSLVLSLIFLVHPLNSQVVFAIPSMQDTLFFFFGILALYFLIRLSSTRSLCMVALCLFLSLLSKETGALFVVMAALYLYWWDRKRLYAFVGIMVLPTVVWLALRIHAIGVNTNPDIAPIDRLGLIGRLFTTPSIMQLYLTKLIFPWKLATAYYWVYPHFSIDHFLIPLLIDLAAVALVMYMAFVIRPRVSRAQHTTYIFFAVWAAIGLLTTLQVIPIDMTACETWFYFSMAGVLGMLGIILVAFQTYIRPSWFLIVAMIVIGVLGVRTAIRGTNYNSDYNLATHDIAGSSDNYIAYYTVAIDLVDQGKLSEAKAYEERSVDIFPTFANTNNLGLTLANLGDYAGARSTYTKALQYGNYYLVYENLGALTLVTGSPATNKQFLVSALEKFPRDATLWMYLAILEDRCGDNAEAKNDITTAANYGQTPQFIYKGIMSGLPFTVPVGDTGKSITI